MEENTEQDNAPTQVEAVGNSPECKNHFGYLSERSLREQIPDECLACKDIVH